MQNPAKTCPKRHAIEPTITIAGIIFHLVLLPILNWESGTGANSAATDYLIRHPQVVLAFLITLLRAHSPASNTGESPCLPVAARGFTAGSVSLDFPWYTAGSFSVVLQ